MRNALLRCLTALLAGVALALVSALMGWGLATRSPVVFEVLRDRNPTFVRLDDGSVRNGYTLKIDNRSFEPRAFQVSLAGLAGETMQTPGAKPTVGPLSVTVAPNQVQSLRVLVRAPPAALVARSLPVNFVLGEPHRSWRAASTFLSADVAP